MKNLIQTRHATQKDVAELCIILNEIIVIGGTTAYESELSDTEFIDHFLTNNGFISCIVAYNTELTLGFQSLSKHTDLPENWADIATFSRTSPKVKGVGLALFRATTEFLENKNYTKINATIRADNRSGMAYYSKIGFTDYAIRKSIPLKDGTPVDRISKQFKI